MNNRKFIFRLRLKRHRCRNCGAAFFSFAPRAFFCSAPACQEARHARHLDQIRQSNNRKRRHQP